MNNRYKFTFRKLYGNRTYFYQNYRAQQMILGMMLRPT